MIDLVSAYPFLSGVRLTEKRGYWLAKCPAHDDDRESLSITVAESGKLLFKCHAGCGFRDICKGFGVAPKQTFPRTEQRRKQIAAAYQYRDESGKLLYESVRFDPKSFAQRSPMRDGSWTWSVPTGTRRVLYRLPELMADKLSLVFVVEGEKDADLLARGGLLATCNVGGAGKWLTQYSRSLAGRDVAIIPDNDAAGHAHAEQVAVALYDIARWVKIVHLPGMPLKGDVSDWLGGGGTIKELVQIVFTTRKWLDGLPKNRVIEVAARHGVSAGFVADLVNLVRSAGNA